MLGFFLCRKYEEIYPPEVGEFVYITDETYTKVQVLRMELMVLYCLDCHVAAPTSNVFAARLLKQLGLSVDDKVYSLTMVSFLLKANAKIAFVFRKNSLFDSHKYVLFMFLVLHRAGPSGLRGLPGIFPEPDRSSGNLSGQSHCVSVGCVGE